MPTPNVGSRRRSRDVKLIAVVRDPVDRAYSNWMHLWVDGLEPIPDVVEACEREADRIAAGWAPFWRYIGLGLYGEQLKRLRGHFPDDQILVLRYRDLIDDPAATMDRVCTFLGIEPGIVTSIPRDNTRPFVERLRTDPELRAHVARRRQSRRAVSA